MTAALVASSGEIALPATLRPVKKHIAPAIAASRASTTNQLAKEHALGLGALVFAEHRRRTCSRVQYPLWAIALALALPCAPSAATAHPHVWATVRSEILLGPDHQITG